MHLSPKALHLLHILVEQTPNAISKQELYDALWPSTFVSETNLAGIALELRSALADDARQPRFIRTVHGYGYAFVGTVDRATLPAAAPAGRFRLVVQGREVPLASGENFVGRSGDVTVLLDDASVSRRHAVLVTGTEAASVQDLESKNGTFLNGQRIAGATPLRDGDAVAFGTVTTVFRDRGLSDSTVTIGSIR